MMFKRSINEQYLGWCTGIEGILQVIANTYNKALSHMPDAKIVRNKKGNIEDYFRQSNLKEDEFRPLRFKKYFIT